MLLAIATMTLACACLYLAPAGALQAAPASVLPGEDPRLMAAYLEAQLALREGFPAQAIARLETCLELDGCPPNIYAALARAYAEQSRNDDARAIVERGLDAFPESVELRLMDARILKADGQVDAAVAVLEQALSVQPHRQDVLDELSELHLLRLRQVGSQEQLEGVIRSLVGVYERMLEARRGVDRIPALLVLSSLYLKAGQLEDAERTAREATQLDMYDLRGYLALGEALEARELPEQAIEAYKQGLLAAPADEEVRTRLGRLLARTRGPEQVVAYYINLAEEYPTNKTVQMMAAAILMEQEKWSEAERRLQHAVQLWPDDIQTRLSLVRTWLKQQLYEKAAAEARKLGNEHHELAPLVALSVAEALESAKKPEEALHLLEDIYQQTPGNENLTLAMLKLHADAGQLDRALQLRDTLPTDQYEYFLGTVMLAEACANAKKFDQAHAMLAALPDAVREQYAEELLHLEALLYRSANDLEQARAKFDALLARNQNDAQYCLDAGLIYQQLGLLDKAEELYLQAVKLNPDDAETYNTLGYFYAETNQKLDKALELIQKALQMKPDAGHIVDSLGWVHYQRGEYEQAVTQLERAVELLEVPDAVIYDHLGDAYARLNRIDKAREAWQKALETDPETTGVAEKLRSHSLNSAL